MDDKPITIFRWVFEVATTFFLFVAACLLSGFVAELVAPGILLVYSLCFFVAILPMMFWMGHCFGSQVDRWGILDIVLLMIGASITIEFIPIGQPFSFLKIIATGLVLRMVIFSGVTALRRMFGGDVK